jgi:parvulin-like peptidyl-prolyl isomerase
MADEIFGKLVAGADFDRMAQLYSEDSTREKGGDWGWVDRKTLAAPLEKAAFSVPTGKISKVIDFGGNYYILKVEERHGGETKSLADARPDIEKRLMQLQAQDLQQKWITSLRSKAYIKTF